MSSSPDDINSDDPESTVLSKYYDIEELQNLKITSKSRSLSFFHINACSPSKNVGDFQHLLSCANKNFDITAITETRITKAVSITNSLKLKITLLNLPQLNLQLVVLFRILLIISHTNLVKT